MKKKEEKTRQSMQNSVVAISFVALSSQRFSLLFNAVHAVHF
jgi:hypothetical protein